MRPRSRSAPARSRRVLLLASGSASSPSASSGRPARSAASAAAKSRRGRASSSAVRSAARCERPPRGRVARALLGLARPPLRARSRPPRRGRSPHRRGARPAARRRRCSRSASASARCALRRSEGAAAWKTAERISGWRNGRPSVVEREQARVLGRLERVAVDAERFEGRRDRLHVVRERDRRDDERSPRVLGERLGPPGEGTLERRPGRNRIGQRLTAGELLGGSARSRPRPARAGCRGWPRRAARATSGANDAAFLAARSCSASSGSSGAQLELLERRGARTCARRRRGRRERIAAESATSRFDREEQRVARWRDRASGRRRRGRAAGSPPRPRRSG